MQNVFGPLFYGGRARQVLNLLFILFSLSCSLGGDGSNDKKSQTYKLDFTVPSWTRMSPGTADHAFYNQKTHSIILLNTLCEKYEATSLHHLISNMLGGVDDIDVEREEKVKFAKRDSLRSFVKGTTDGVSIFLVIQTLRKNRCIYDFVMISQTPDKREKDIEDFEKFLSNTKIN